MGPWFTTKWVWGAAPYLGCLLLLASYALAGDHNGAYLILLGVTAPAGPIMLYPIYFAMGLANSVWGYGLLDGSPASLAAGVAGYTVAAAVNVVLIRLTASGIARWVGHSRARVRGPG